MNKCPLCDRKMVSGPSTDWHHLIPKSQGGVDTVEIHRICHQKIHSLFNEKELKNFYSTFELLREHEEIKKFIKWVSKKDPEYYDKSKRSNIKRK